MSVPLEDINRLIDETTALLAEIVDQKERFVAAANQVDQTGFMVAEQHAQVINAAGNVADNTLAAASSASEAKSSETAAAISQTASFDSQKAAQSSALATQLDAEAVALASEYIVTAHDEIEVFHGESLGYRNSALDSKRKAQAAADRTDADIIEMAQLLNDIIALADQVGVDSADNIILSDNVERLAELTQSYKDQALSYKNAAQVDAQTASAQAALSIEAAKYAHFVIADAETFRDDAERFSLNSAKSATASKHQAELSADAKDLALASELRTQKIHDDTVGFELQAEEHALESKAYAKESLDNANKLAEISSNLINTQTLIATLHPMA